MHLWRPPSSMLEPIMKYGRKKNSIFFDLQKYFFERFQIWKSSFYKGSFVFDCIGSFVNDDFQILKSLEKIFFDVRKFRNVFRSYFMMDSNILEGGRHKCINQDGEPPKPLKLPIWEVFLEADSYSHVFLWSDRIANMCSWWNRMVKLLVALCFRYVICDTTCSIMF